jgi:hypothetical protein
MRIGLLKPEAAGHAKVTVYPARDPGWGDALNGVRLPLAFSRTKTAIRVREEAIIRQGPRPGKPAEKELNQYVEVCLFILKAKV